MKIFSIVLLILSGCASYSGTTAQGWRWDSPSDSVTTDRMDAVVAVTGRVFEQTTGRKVPVQAFDKISDVQFTYFQTFCSPEEPFGNDRCLGQVDYEEKKMWVTIQSSCLARTSFVHELVHIFASSTGMSDSGHNNPLLFKKARGDDEITVEHRAQEEAFTALGCTEIVLF